MPNRAKQHPRCSIVNLDNRIIVIDHHNQDRHIEPACGVDAMAWHVFLKSQTMHNPSYEQLADDFLADIADGKMPVSELIERVRNATGPAKHMPQCNHLVAEKPLQRSMR